MSSKRSPTGVSGRDGALLGTAARFGSDSVFSGIIAEVGGGAALGGGDFRDLLRKRGDRRVRATWPRNVDWMRVAEL